MAFFAKFISLRGCRASAGTIVNIQRHCSGIPSCLYVSGKYGTSLTNTVIPDLDISNDFQSQDFAENLKARKMDLDKFDLKAIAHSAKYLAWLDAEDTRLESRRKEISLEISKLTSDADKEARDKLVTESREVKQAMKVATRDRWELEDSTVLGYLHLPNRLHENTPRDVDQQIHIFGSEPAGFGQKSHVEIATETNELEVSPYSSASYYLFGRLAHLELILCERMQNFLLDSGLDMMACPDFTRSVVMEGCEPSTFLHPDKFLSLAETSDLGNIRSGHGVHLTGGASLYPFVSYFVKNVFANPSVLPINYFSVGRQYVSVNPTDTFSLFRAQQSTAVQCFSVSQCSGSMMDQFDHLTDLLRKFYDGLGLHYRLVVKSAPNLDAAQSYKVSIEMFAPSLQNFVEVGHLATYDDYLSKRLMLKFEEENNEKKEKTLKNLFVVSGSAINITKVIACIIEQTNGKLMK